MNIDINNLEEERERLFETDVELETLNNDLELITELNGSIQDSLSTNGSISAIAYETYNHLLKFLKNRGYAEHNVAVESYYTTVLTEEMSLESFTGKLSKAVKEAITKILNKIWVYLKDKARAWGNAFVHGSDYITKVNKRIKAIELLTEEEFADSLSRQDFGVLREAVLGDEVKDEINVRELSMILDIYNAVIETAVDILRYNVAFFRNLTRDLYQTGSISDSIVSKLRSNADYSSVATGKGPIVVESVVNGLLLKTVKSDLKWAVKTYHTRFVATGNARTKIAPMKKKEFIDLLIQLRDVNKDIKPFYDMLAREMGSASGIIKQLEEKIKRKPGHGDTEYFHSGLAVASKISKEMDNLGANYLAPVHRLNSAFERLSSGTSDHVSNMKKRAKANKESGFMGL